MGILAYTPPGVTIQELRKSSLDLTWEMGVGATMRRTYLIEGSHEPADCIRVPPIHGQPYADLPALILFKKEWKVLSCANGGKMHMICHYKAEPQEFPSGTNEGESPDGSQYELGSITRSVHVVRAIQETINGQTRQQHHWPPDGPLGGGLGINDVVGPMDEGVPAGTNIDEAVIGWSETHVRKTLKEGYRQTVLGGLHHLNLNDFRGWESGEVRFTGCNARKLRNGRWEIKYDFLIVANQQLAIDYYDKLIGDEMQAQVSLLGHDYLWYDHGLVEKAPVDVYQYEGDLGDSILVSAVKGVHQAPMYERYDFAGLYDDEMPFVAID